MLVNPIYYPINDPNGDFIYSIVTEDTITIASFYNMSSESHEGNIFSMFQSVPFELWIGYGTSFFVFVTVCYVGSWLLKQRLSALWNITCAFLDQDNFPTTSLFIAILSTVIMLCSFFMESYATNSMSTDLVTIDKPVIVNSYQDIIDREILIGLVEQMPEYAAFKDAPDGSMEAQMFKHAHVLTLVKETLK